MKPGSVVAYPFAAISLLLATSAQARPFESIIQSFNIISEQSPLRDYIIGNPEEQVSTGVIISDNATVLAPNNSVIRDLKRKPWEDPEDYSTFGADAYEGTGGQDRARGNLERFVQRRIVPESPWEEGEKVETLSGNEIWWESRDSQKKIQPADVVVTSIADKVSNGEIWVLEGSSRIGTMYLTKPVCGS
ncbi:unnamed protein product [Alternaria alternata]